MKNYKIVQIGCGKMSLYTLKYAMEKGYDVIGAFDNNSSIIGKDISSILGGEDTGIIINDSVNLKSYLEELKPDVAIVTTTSLISELEGILRICCECGVNAITTCEEAFYPSVSNPHVTEELDKLAKEHNVTITGTGYQDVFWGNLIYTLGGATYQITKIKGSSSYNVEDYGIALAEAHGAGYSLEKFANEIASADEISDEERQKLIESGNYSPSYMWNVVPWISERFGFTLTSMKQVCVPIVAKDDLKSNTLGKVIPKGDVTGMRAIVTGHTKEGVIIEAECIGKVYEKDDVDTNAWTIEGEPSTSVVITKPDTVKLTCATIVNRIPDLITAGSGYVPTSRMGEIKYN